MAFAKRGLQIWTSCLLLMPARDTLDGLVVATFGMSLFYLVEQPFVSMLFENNDVKVAQG